jgi:hypothetical protein
VVSWSHCALPSPIYCAAGPEILAAARRAGTSQKKPKAGGEAQPGGLAELLPGWLALALLDAWCLR